MARRSSQRLKQFRRNTRGSQFTYSTLHHAPVVLSVFRGPLAAYSEASQKEKDHFCINS